MPNKQTLAEAFNYIEPEFIEQKRFERYITSVDQMPPLPDGQNVTIDEIVEGKIFTIWKRWHLIDRGDVSFESFLFNKFWFYIIKGFS